MKKIIKTSLFTFIFICLIGFISAGQVKDNKDKQIEQLENTVYILNRLLTEKTDSLEIYKTMHDCLVVGIYVTQKDEYMAYNALFGFLDIDNERGDNIISQIITFYKQ